MTPLSEALLRFRELHALVKKGALPETQRAEYVRGRTELTQVLGRARQLSTSKGTERGMLRMAQVLKLDLRLGDGKLERTATIDLGEEGAAALVKGDFAVGSLVKFALYLPTASGAKEPLRGTARVRARKPQSGSFRLSLEFEELDPAGREFLLITIVDAVLARLSQRA